MADNKREYLDKTGLDHLVEGLNNKFVNTAGDTMTGALTIQGGDNSCASGHHLVFKNSTGELGGSIGLADVKSLGIYSKGPAIYIRSNGSLNTGMEIYGEHINTSTLVVSGKSNYREGIRLNKVGDLSSIWFNTTSDVGYNANMWGITARESTKKLYIRGGSSKPNDLVIIDQSGGITTNGDNSLMGSSKDEFNYAGNNTGSTIFINYRGAKVRITKYSFCAGEGKSGDKAYVEALGYKIPNKTKNDILTADGGTINMPEIPLSPESYFWADQKLNKESKKDIAPTFSPYMKMNSSVNNYLSPNVDTFIAAPTNGLIWHDLLAFSSSGTPTTEIKTGESWSVTKDNTYIYAPFIKKQHSSFDITAGGRKGVRWTWQAFQYSSFYWLVVNFTYSSTKDILHILLEEKRNDGKWYTLGETYSGEMTAPIFLRVQSDDGSNNQNIRLTIEEDPEHPIKGQNKLSTIQLLSCRWGDQGMGDEFGHPFGWDYEPNLLPRHSMSSLGTTSSPWNAVHAKQFIKKDGKSTEILMADGSVKMVTEVGNNYDDTKCFYKDGTRAATDDFNMGNHNIKNLAKNGGIYWNPCMETDTDKTDVASIVVESKAYEYTRLVLTMQNDANDNIELRTGGKKIIVGDGFGNSANTFTFPNKNGILATLDDIKSEVDNAGQKFTPRGPDKDVLKFSDDKTELYTTYSTTKDGQTDVGTAIAVGGILKNSVLQNLSVSDVFDRLFGLVERRTYDTPVLTNLQYTDVEKPTIPGEDLKATGFSFKLDGKDGFKDFISTSYYMLDGVRHDLTRDELNSINTKGETTIINFATPYTNQAKEGEKKTVTLLLHLDYNLYYTNNKEQQDFKAASLESTVDISDDSKVDFTWPNVAYADLPDNNYITGISSLNTESNFVLSTKKGSTTGTITSQSEDLNPTITSLKCIILRKGYNYSLPTVNYLAVSETDVKHQYTKNYSTTRKYLVYVTFDDFPSSLYAALPLDGVEVKEIISNNNRLGDETHNGFMLEGIGKSGKYSTKMADTSFQLSVTEDTVLYSLDGNTPSGYESFKYPSASSGKKNGKKVILKYNGVNVADKTYSNEVVYFKDFPESFVMHVNNTDTIDFNSITSEYNNNFYITKNNVKTELLRKSSSNNPDTTLREIPVCFSTKQYGYGSINTTNIEFEAIPLTQNNKNWDVSLIYNGDTLETKTYKGSLYYPALFMGYTKRNNCLKYKSATVPTISYNGSVVYNNLESIENDSKGNLNATKFLPNGELYDVKLSGETGDTRNFVVISTKAIQKDSEGNYLVKQDGKNKNDMFLDFDNVYGYQEYNMKIEALKSMVNQQSIKYNTYVSNPGIIFEGKYQFSIEFDG